METKLFDLVSDYQPQGDQPKAIQELVDGIQKGKKQQVLLGATGTGKTFTISNVIAKVNKPHWYSHITRHWQDSSILNFKEFFPNNRVEYFVSNFDYYQPEAIFQAPTPILTRMRQPTWSWICCEWQLSTPFWNEGYDYHSFSRMYLRCQQSGTVSGDVFLNPCG